MQKICDLHLHSKYSGGASKSINISKIAFNCKKKGIEIVATGDCFHPLWLNELKNELLEYSEGVFYSPKVPNVNFIIQTEIEVIWNYNSNMKKVHFIILFPNFEKLEESVEYLSKFGNLRKEGRAKLYNTPEKIIFGLNSIDNDIEIIPAHIFTPFFGIFGENSQFNNLREALGDGSKYVNAVETGLSADPLMIRSISDLDNISIISNSDSHSTNYHRLGREATILKINNLNYRNLIDSIRKNRIIKTYEFKPSAGKYYYDGHREDRHIHGEDYFCSPKLNKIKCPYCGKKLTKGVLSRVYELSDHKNPISLNFQYIVPLLNLIALILGGTEYSKKNISLYQDLVTKNGGEFNIWEGKSNFDGFPEELIDAIDKVRKGNFWFIPGHDATYGKLQFDA
ncbi:MAG: endonuclease Q family protein [Promethearchaeota archaeon]